MYNVNLAECYKDDNDTRKAKVVLESIADVIDKVGFKALACDYYLRFALICYDLGENEKGNALVDKAINNAGDAGYAQPLYEDFRQIAHILIRHGEREKTEKIVGLMREYGEKNKGTIEQLIANRTIADYYKNIGEFEQAAEYYELLDDLYERRLKELKGIQVNVLKRMKNADNEISNLNKMLHKNEELASREPMTKLLNRTSLLKVAAEFIDTAVKNQEKVGAIFIDIDYFKEINDTYGHARGDAVIREVAGICRNEESKKVRFARYGGDEFFGITCGLIDSEVIEIAKKICTNVRKADIPNENNPNGHRVTLSVGVVNISTVENVDTIIEIAKYADKAVYYAKNSGRNAIFQLDYDSTEEADKQDRFLRIEY